MKEIKIKKTIKIFIKTLNDLNVEKVLAELFAKNAIIDDVSVGDKFKNIEGVRTYLETFFVGYKTVTKLESIHVFDERNAKAKVDFTGSFGHETGTLNFTLNNGGLIIKISASLD
jgi:hypothetical protein